MQTPLQYNPNPKYPAALSKLAKVFFLVGVAGRLKATVDVPPKVFPRARATELALLQGRSEAGTKEAFRIWNSGGFRVLGLGFTLRTFGV